MNEIVLLDEWYEVTDIDWWRQSRKKLNKIIRRFNKWQTKQDFDPQEGNILLAYIENGINTIGSQNGGSGYLEELELMKSHVQLTTPLDWKQPR